VEQGGIEGHGRTTAPGAFDFEDFAQARRVSLGRLFSSLSESGMKWNEVEGLGLTTESFDKLRKKNFARERRLLGLQGSSVFFPERSAVKRNEVEGYGLRSAPGPSTSKTSLRQEDYHQAIAAR